MTEWLRELHAQDPYLPLFIGICAVFGIVTLIALVVSILEGQDER